MDAQRGPLISFAVLAALVTVMLGRGLVVESGRAYVAAPSQRDTAGAPSVPADFAQPSAHPLTKQSSSVVTVTVKSTPQLGQTTAEAPKLAKAARQSRPSTRPVTASRVATAVPTAARAAPTARTGSSPVVSANPATSYRQKQRELLKGRDLLKVRAAAGDYAEPRDHVSTKAGVKRQKTPDHSERSGASTEFDAAANLTPRLQGPARR